ncbi:hypothetical protein GCM10010452_42360 [Crossiella cryophila]
MISVRRLILPSMAPSSASNEGWGGAAWLTVNVFGRGGQSRSAELGWVRWGAGRGEGGGFGRKAGGAGGGRGRRGGQAGRVGARGEAEGRAGAAEMEAAPGEGAPGCRGEGPGLGPGAKGWGRVWRCGRVAARGVWQGSGARRGGAGG